ncbi:MAG TPA: hypothetical protein VMM14_08605 [Acidimicrobiia bacterium]|nr:hypothetical protein [Acidimicrobiia bacterium]
MPKRHTGLVVGKDFHPPEGAQPLDWCYLTVDISDDERISVRIRRDQVSRADVGDVVLFRRPRDISHPVPRVTRVGSDPGLLPPVKRVAQD